MPPSILHFSQITDGNKVLRFRSNHLIVQFTRYQPRSALAMGVLDSVLGRGDYDYAAEPVGNWTYLRTSVDGPDLKDKAKLLRDHGEVEFAELDVALVPTSVPKDPTTYATTPEDERQWALEKLDMFRAWDLQTGTDDVLIGLLDSGLELDSENSPGLDPYEPLGSHLRHEDLDGNRFLAGMNFIDEVSWPFDDFFIYAWAHGNNMSGVIAGTAGNEVGLAGMNWGSNVCVPKVDYTSDNKERAPADKPYLASTAALVHLGIRDVLDFAAKPSNLSPSGQPKRVVFNLSIQLAGEDEEDSTSFAEYPEGTFKAIFSAVQEAGAVICLSAGNAHGAVREPGAWAATSDYAPNVLVVGAMDENDKYVDQTSLGLGEMVFAPGHQVWTTHRSADPYFLIDQSSSIANAHVTAAVSLVWSEDPGLEGTEVVDLIKDSCREPEAGAKSSYTTADPEGNWGRGIIQPYEALKRLKPSVCLVLDKSGSMGESSGAPGTTKLEAMKSLASDLIHSLDFGSSLGVVSFNGTAESLQDLTVVEKAQDGTYDHLGLAATDDTRTPAVEKIQGLEKGGSTSIAAGVKKAMVLLDPAKSDRTIIILTDGKETQDPYLEEIVGTLGDITVFAIGWGSPEVLEPSGLMGLTQETGGYLLMMDQIDTDGLAQLPKYLAQVMAEISGYELVLDPSRMIGPGETQNFEVSLGQGDSTAEVVLFNPDRVPLKVDLRAPDGSEWDIETPASRKDRVLDYRFTMPHHHLALPKAHHGKWRIEVSLDDGIEINGRARYSLLVRSRSRLKMRCRIRQDSPTPGSTMTMSVQLGEKDISLASPETVTVEVADPGGKTWDVEGDLTETGTLEFSFTGSEVGVYKWLVRAQGVDANESPFQRECRLTSAIWQAAGTAGTGPGAPGQPTTE